MTFWLSDPLDFALSSGREATGPPEARGLARDEVRLLVARPPAITHAGFHDLARHLRPGDLVVVNTSATLPAALDGRSDGRPVAVHLSTRLDDGRWTVELRQPGGRGPMLHASSGQVVEVAGGGRIVLEEPDVGERRTDRVRLWRGRVEVPGPVLAHLESHGRPITYAHRRGRSRLEDHQTVFARDPGSAEMPSAGRPFSLQVVTDLVARGVGVAPVTLHAGVSSLEADEAPRPERFEVPAVTARMVADARRDGGRVVAVGTTVTRALESAADPSGVVRPARGWTDLVLGPDRPARVVTGLVTGWHEPGTSHLQLLQAVAGHELVARTYEAALAGPYLWHEFGDSCLLLP